MQRDLSANRKYYSSSQVSAVQRGSSTQPVRRRPTNNGVDSTDKYYASSTDFAAPEVKGETESISDVSDIASVLDAAVDLYASGVTLVRVPIVADLVQKARTNLELRVGREELTFDQADTIEFSLLEPVIPAPVKEPEPEVVEEVEEEVVAEEVVAEEVVAEEEAVDDGPSIASLFGATDDDEGDD